MKPITIRPMTSEDILVLTAWVVETPLWQRYSLRADALVQQLTRALTTDDLLLVADDGPADRACGFAWCLPKGGFGRSAYLRLLGVRADLTGRGVGADLLVAAEEQLAACSPDLFLMVSDFNESAQRFYQRQGYEQVGAVPGYVLPDVTELIYRKKFPQS